VQDPKTILLICHSFPPYPGIGGRRWAKFAKYLQRDGHTVKVIASQNPFKTSSEWSNDVKGLDVTYLPFNYPSVLKKSTGLNLLDKIAYRLALAYVKTFGKGNYYDRSLFWKEQIIKAASEIIRKHQIKNVIVTCPPFHMAHHCLDLKTLFKDINLISDFRDLWTTDYSLSPLKHMSQQRQTYETSIEKEVLKSSDVVLTVSEEMVNEFRRIEPKANCHTLKNGFDEDDFVGDSPVRKSTDGKINLVFTGTLYTNLDNLFVPLLDALKKMRMEFPDHYKKLSFHFYGSAPEKIRALCSGEKSIKFYGTIPLKEVYRKISEADLCMLFLNDAYTFSLSTKFYEYVSQKKKIVLFSNQGKTADLIEQKDLGYWISPERTFDGLMNLIELSKSGAIHEWKTTLNIYEYSVKTITKQLEAYLK
jgi:hypothetical protein